MKKVIVIGCPGGGKSTFSRALQKITELPLFHLDMLYWNSDKTTVDKAVFLAKLSEILGRDEWIIDGNYASTLNLRIEASDTVFFLDYPTEVCLSGVRERRGKPRSDMPWTEEGDDAEFIAFINSYNEKQRPEVLDLLSKYSDKKIHVFKTREEANAFLNSIQKQQKP